VSIVIDTGVVIDLEHLDLGDHASDEALVSAVTVGELAFGLDVRDEAQRSAWTARFRAVLDDFEIIPFGIEEAKLYGALASLVRSIGRDPRPRRMDLQIAATAAAARVPLLATNPADFTGLERLLTVVPAGPFTARP
jgi:predicted nucleic acid-binding protein